MIPEPQRPIGAFWALLSAFLGVISVFCLLQADWITFENVQSVRQSSSFGLISYCRQFVFDGHNHHYCHSYTSNEKVENLGRFWAEFQAPSKAWTAALVLYGCGSFALMFAGFAALPITVLPAAKHEMLVRPIARTQALAVVLNAIALFLIPLDLSSNQFQCDQRAIYHFGKCSIGWAYALAGMTTLLAMVCPVLAQFTTFHPISSSDHHGSSVHRTAAYHRLVNSELVKENIGSTPSAKEYFI